VGAVQKLATVVIVGLVALATLLVVYLANETHRRDTEAATQEQISIQRGVALFVQYCVTCHGPAGEGVASGEPGRIGASLGGNTYGTELNQKGIQPDGTPWPGGVSGRAQYLTTVINNGLICNPPTSTNCVMPAWGASGELDAEQINDLVLMIQHVDWNYVYNQAIQTDGGYPTPPGTQPPAASPTAAAAAQPTQAAAASGGKAVTIDLEDIKFVPDMFSIPANTPVTVTLVNKGQLPHDFSIDQLKISTGTIQPGQSKQVTINAPAGSYQYYCNEPGHKAAGMVGTLTVK